jgi:hypothetical protein
MISPLGELFLHEDVEARASTGAPVVVSLAILGKPLPRLDRLGEPGALLPLLPRVGVPGLGVLPGVLLAVALVEYQLAEPAAERAEEAGLDLQGNRPLRS